MDKYVTYNVFAVDTKHVIGFNNLEDLGFPTDHISCDSHNCNNYGRRLAEMCKFTNCQMVAVEQMLILEQSTVLVVPL